MADGRFSGKHVVVTGAGKDIGRATALRFASEGADVMLIGRTREPLAETAALAAEAGGQAWIFTADVTKADQVQSAVDAAVASKSRIDVLVNNAGNRDRAPFLEILEENWDDVIATNLKGPFLLSQRVAREMVKTGGGVILHNASVDATGSCALYTSYDASKAGLLGLMRTMAIELAPHGIRVNCVSPGYTQSVNLETAVGPAVAAYLNGSFSRVPMQRMVQVEEVAATFAFLASDDASGITGAEFRVDCGLTANLFVLETLPGFDTSA